MTFSLTPTAAFPQVTSEDFPSPLRFALDDVLFNGPIEVVNFTGGAVTEDADGILTVPLGGGASYQAGTNITIVGDTINAVPTGQSGSFQYNASQVFGQTVGLSWTAEIGITSARIDFSDLLISPARTLTIRPQYMQFNLDVVNRGQQYMCVATLGSHIFSTITYVPDANNLPTLDRPGLWVGGPINNATALAQCYDAWFLSNEMSFAQRDAQSTFTKIQPMVRKGSAASATAFDNAIQISIDGGLYWIPCYAQ
jgi:hypothetical protein